MKRYMTSLTLLLLSGVLAARVCADDGLLGTHLPEGFRAFGLDSPWNTPIGRNPRVSPLSAQAIRQLEKHSKSGRLEIGYRNWTIPLWVIDSEQAPPNRIWFRKDSYPPLDPEGQGYVDGIPIPAGVYPDPKPDGHMLLVDPKRMVSWDISHARRLADGGWSATRLERWDLEGTGVRPPYAEKRWWMVGARGSGMPLIAGLVRLDQVEAGEIENALAFASPINRKSSSVGGAVELCPPAARNDGTHVGPDTLPMGVRLQLDPGLDLDAYRLSPEAKVVARAMQRFGLINSDSTRDSFKLYFQGLGERDSPWERFDFGGIGRIPLRAFRVLECELRYK